MKNLSEHAIVIGASMGGLLAARALSDFYTTVTVLERDAFPAADIPRKGVPQGRHIHGLLARGSAILEEFFPGYNNEVVAQSGGLLGDVANDVSWIGRNVKLANGTSGLIGLLASRPVLEGHLRRRVLRLPNVRAMENCAVQGLASDAARKSVTGVRIRVEGKLDETVSADLVVDATGRGSSSADWLEELGYQPPVNEKVEIGIVYMTRTYRRRPTDLDGKLGIVVAGSAPNWRNGVMLAQEDDSWIVSAGGFLGDDAPDNDQGFLAYLATLPTAEIHDVVARAEPLSDYRRYRYASSVRWRFEKLARFPENYLVFGDAICSFNPIYGQGMTVAAQEALTLHQCLLAGSNHIARRFFRAAAKIVDIPWDIAVGNDLRHPQVKGARPPMLRFINWYIGKLHLAATSDSALATTFLKVVNLMIPPPSLLSPAIAWRVWRGNWRLALSAPSRAIEATCDITRRPQK
ncbi:Putative epoxidase LasC [Caballeronia arationis]|jgi:2-polyprenyl-6-methoxyphenol hydroxylase-like FAD-dependent oxidoreductase|uniref:2-polyprenyl-6-methoxyphenol hydroxylase n=1 Tax=Caballeronia arationis TaxID=1777142 RepID=A0A7Z7I272_9BURK|nr:monooxygenase [Caballeronia arationis]SAL06675.1 Putative epoxidase LasC [Caballeronia arationis]SOE54761.1 2-polyprenyl-6-methoxyphenol hydroxylase [Caballeronia arationis]